MAHLVETVAEIRGLIPDYDIAFFYIILPAGRTVALGSAQFLTEMSTSTSLGVKAAGAYG